MNQYHIERAGRDFVVFAGDVRVLKCSTKRKAEVIVAAALGLVDKPLERRATINEPLVERAVTRFPIA
jgi:hypothetical protein